MARKSRKINLIPESTSVKGCPETVFNTAVYARISVETEEKRASDSIGNQVEFLKNYIALQEELKLTDLYIDNDISGTGFDRPEFNRLMSDIKKGRINCIVVKDLSRFGRNYVETGEYLERIFPLLKVRFIAINDRFDSFSGQLDIITPFKNIVNEIYAKDISRKICSSVIIRQKKGEYIGGMAAYGYEKDPEDKHRLIIDPETAPVVKRIFECKAKGDSYLAIARSLNEEQIPSPAQYKYSKGILQNSKNKSHQWNALNVKRILKNLIYTGNMVQGKYRQSFHENRLRTEVDEEQWIVVPDTHEAIIEVELYGEVKRQLKDKQAARNNSLRQEDNIENLFKGRIYCKNCGKKMVLHSSAYTRVDGSTNISAHYNCRNYRQHLTEDCRDKRFDYYRLIDTVKLILVEYSKVFQSSDSKVPERQYEEQKSIEKALNRIDKIKTIEFNLYSDYAEGLLDKEEYLAVKDNYRVETDMLLKELKVLYKQLKQKKKQDAEYNKAKQQVEAFLNDKELTPEMIHCLIERITVVGGNKMEIKFRFQDEMATESDHITSTASSDELLKGSEVDG